MAIDSYTIGHGMLAVASDNTLFVNKFSGAPLMCFYILKCAAVRTVQ